MLVVIRQQRQQRQIKNHRIEMMFWFSLYRTIAWRLWRHIKPFNYLSEALRINENIVLYLSICFDRFTGWLVGKTSPQRLRDSFHVVFSWVQGAHPRSWSTFDVVLVLVLVVYLMLYLYLFYIWCCTRPRSWSTTTRLRLSRPDPGAIKYCAGTSSEIA